MIAAHELEAPPHGPTGVMVENVRAALAVSVAELAALLNVHPSTVHRWERSGRAATNAEGISATLLEELVARLPRTRNGEARVRTLGRVLVSTFNSRGRLAALSHLLRWLQEVQHT